MTHLALYALDFPRIQLDASVVTFERRKATALLFYLALSSTRHTRDHLADLFWAQHPQARAAANLRRVLTSIRDTIGPPFLAADRYTVGLAPDASITVDARDLLQTTRRVTGAQVPLADLELVASRYQRDFLEGWYLDDSPAFEQWRQQQADQCRRALELILSTVIHRYSEAEQWLAALQVAQRWVVLDRLHEPAHRALISLYLQTDQRLMAAQQYEHCITMLREEYDAPPSEATVALGQRLQQSAAIHATPSAHVTTARVPTPPIASLLGREAELDYLRDCLLYRENCRLLTIVGPGGIGKSHLALTAAHALAPSFQDGACVATLANVTSSELVPSALADALGITLDGRQDAVLCLQTLLAPRHLLLVVDNAEHLPEMVPLLRAFLQHAPLLKMLVTSRERFAVAEEWTLALQGLQVPPTLNPPDPQRYSAVALFLQRARQVQPQFGLSADTTGAVCRVTQLVGGSPLALELAAAWLRLLSVSEIVRHLEESLDFLRDTLRHMPARHRSLRAVFEQSWRLLTASEQHACARLSVFLGGFDSAAAAHVAQVSLPLLLVLADKSLVQHNPSGGFVLHESIRQFAAEQLAARESPTLLAQRHTEYYLGLLHQTSAGQPTPSLLAAIDNIRAAWGWAVAHDCFDVIGDALEGVHQVVRYQSWYQEGRDQFGTAAVRFRGCLADLSAWHREILGRLEVYEAECCAYLGEYQCAHQLVAQSVSLLRPLHARAALARALGMAGMVAYLTGRLDEAQAYLRESLTGFQETTDVAGEARVLFLLGITARKLGLYTEAKDVLERALTAYRRQMDPMGMGEVQNALGLLYYREARHADAEVLFSTCLTLWREMGDARGVAATLNNLGIVAHERGNFGRALDLFQASADGCRAIGSLRGVAVALANLGEVHADRGDFDRAADCFHESVALYRRMGDTASIAEPLLGLGVHYWEQDDPVQAEVCFRECVAMLKQSGERGKHTEALSWLALMREVQGDDVEATRCVQDATTLAQTAPHGRGTVRLRLVEAVLAHAHGRERVCHDTLGVAREEALRLNIVPLRAEVELEQALRAGEPQRSKRLTLLTNASGAPFSVRTRAGTALHS